jgi:hypothetical protein
LENRSEGQSGGDSIDFPGIDKPSVDTRAGGEGTDAELGLGVSRYDRQSTAGPAALLSRQVCAQLGFGVVD